MMESNKSYDRHMFIRDNKLEENDGKRLICVDQGSTMGGDLGWGARRPLYVQVSRSYLQLQVNIAQY